MPNDDPRSPLDPALQRAAAAYHQPPPTPRRELWQQIQYARAIRHSQTLRRRTHWRPLAWGMGIAATLALGIGLGRLSVRRPPPPSPVAAAAAVATPANTSAYTITAAAYLRQTEVFLTLFRMSVQRGTIDPLTASTVRPLLATNRLLLDSPASNDPKLRLLLEDLELILAQIAQLSPQPAKEDLELIASGMQQADIMTRLWHNASAAPVGAQGI